MSTACGGDTTCGSPTAQTICVANTVASTVIAGCNLACLPGYQIAESIIDCPCQPYNYNICFPN